MIYVVNFNNISTGAVADTDKTLIAIRAGDTLGYRFLLLELFVGPADDAPVDLNVRLALKRVDDVSAGSAGTPDSTPTPEPIDSLARASVITAGVDYITGGAEPSAYGNDLWVGDMNRRNSISQIWDENDPQVPVFNRDQLAGLVGAPRTGAAAVLSGKMVFKEV